MISFETRFNEATGLWQYRHPGKHWSEPMKLGKIAEFLRREVAKVPAPVNSERFNEQWSKPLAHAPKRRSQSPRTETQGQWEIRGGKVQRIASSAAERRAQELAELAELLDLNP